MGFQLARRPLVIWRKLAQEHGGPIIHDSLSDGCACAQVSCRLQNQSKIQTQTRTRDVLVFCILFCLRILWATLRADMAAACDGTVWGYHCSDIHGSLFVHGWAWNGRFSRRPTSPAS